MRIVFIFNLRAICAAACLSRWKQSWVFNFVEQTPRGRLSSVAWSVSISGSFSLLVLFPVYWPRFDSVEWSEVSLPLQLPVVSLVFTALLAASRHWWHCTVSANRGQECCAAWTKRTSTTATCTLPPAQTHTHCHNFTYQKYNTSTDCQHKHSEVRLHSVTYRSQKLTRKNRWNVKNGEKKVQIFHPCRRVHPCFIKHTFLCVLASHHLIWMNKLWMFFSGVWRIIKVDSIASYWPGSVWNHFCFLVCKTKVVWTLLIKKNKIITCSGTFTSKAHLWQLSSDLE